MKWLIVTLLLATCTVETTTREASFLSGSCVIIGTESDPTICVDYLDGEHFEASAKSDCNAGEQSFARGLPCPKTIISKEGEELNLSKGCDNSENDDSPYVTWFYGEANVPKECSSGKAVAQESSSDLQKVVATKNLSKPSQLQFVGSCSEDLTDGALCVDYYTSTSYPVGGCGKDSRGLSEVSCKDRVGASIVTGCHLMFSRIVEQRWFDNGSPNCDQLLIDPSAAYSM